MRQEDDEAQRRHIAAVTRRGLLGSVAPAATLSLASGAAAQTASGVKVANAADFGVRGNGSADDQPRIAAALAAAQVVQLPPGRFRLAAPLRLRDGQVLIGQGKSGWEPYTGRGAPTSPVRSELIVESGLAVDARNTNSAAVCGVSIRARQGTQSLWGAPPGCQPGTAGIDITGAAHFAAQDISFHGLEAGVTCVASSGTSAHMPQFEDWLAHDCGTVFLFRSDDADFYAVRDARIGNGMGAVHCGRVLHGRKCDGLRIHDARLFQCKENALLIERSPFVSITALTAFETGEDAIDLRDCDYASLSGIQIARTGFFRAGRLQQRSALRIEECTDVSVEGLVEQSVGRAVTIVRSRTVALNLVVGTPFWSTGAPTSAEGAIHIQDSRSVQVNASFGGKSYWVAVWADATSAATASGRISVDGPAGVVRCVALQAPPLGHVVRRAAATRLQAGERLQVDTLRVLVPPGQGLVTCAIESTSPDLRFSDGSRIWSIEDAAEPGGGWISLERRSLFQNVTETAQYAAVPVYLINPGRTTIEVPAGHELRISMALE